MDAIERKASLCIDRPIESDRARNQRIPDKSLLKGGEIYRVLIEAFPSSPASNSFLLLPQENLFFFSLPSFRWLQRKKKKKKNKSIYRGS